ncbi:oxygenase [Pseudonocardia endophytica]|uniref:Oxygenase n=1 Tax=Pseudonocardia endophytica TaxID=401976 RepID=A0A4R1HX25_PSEEN|nr:oxygenase [Pseudonocardia endophytica]
MSAADGGIDTVDTADVVVVGAGPVGLMLAGELGSAGVDVVVLERLSEPTGESRAGQLSARTAELLAERGLHTLLGEARAESGTHLAGIPVDLSGSDSAHAGVWKVPQRRTELALADRARSAGARILRGRRLVDLDDGPDTVSLQVGSTSGTHRVRARYVVGCDGGSGPVRELAGFESVEAPATRELLRADVTGVRIPDRRFERTPHGFAVAHTAAGVTRVMVHRFGQQPLARAAPPDFAEIVETWREVTGEDLTGGRASWTDAFGNEHRLVTHYRRGRVLLAGDAAHWHLPIGGQAINVGLQDAVNLGWKLAGVLRGDPHRVLDSYHDERRPVAARTLEWVMAQESLLLGGPEVDPVRALLAEAVRGPAAQRYLADALGGLDVDYRHHGHAGGGRRFHPTLLHTAEGIVPSGEVLGSGRGIVLTDRPELVSVWEPRIVVARPPDGVATVVRPDGHLAWSGTNATGLLKALTRWFGSPSRRGPATKRAAATSRTQRTRRTQR